MGEDVFGRTTGSSEVSLDRFVENWLLKARGQKPATARSYRWGIEGLLGALSLDHPSQLTAEHLWNYLEESTDPASTKRVKIAAVKSYHRFFCLKTNTSPNGILAIPYPKVDLSEPEPRISFDEATVLLCSVFDPIEVRLVYGGLYTGQRITELSLMKPWKDGVIIVPVTKRRAKRIPVHPQLEAVRDLIFEEPATVNQLAYRAQKLSQSEDIAFSPHDLRKMFIRVLDEAGVDWRVVQSMTGHLTDVTSRHYSAPSLAQRRRAIKHLSYLDNRSRPVLAYQPQMF